MATKKHQNSAASGTKTEQHVGLGMEDLFPINHFELSARAYEFIWGKERYINDETLRFVRDAFKGFRDEVQDLMVECLDDYYEKYGPEGETYLPCIGVEHIDLLLNQIAYKIDHGHNRY